MLDDVAPKNLLQFLYNLINLIIHSDIILFYVVNIKKGKCVCVLLLGGLSKSNDYELSFDILKHTIKGFIKTKNQTTDYCVWKLLNHET